MINCPWCGEKIKIPQLDYNLYLENINELQNKIDKAIEYIEKYNIEGIPFYSVIKDDLLEILKGVDKE